MANALATLFTDIANSIRSKTGSTEKLSPSEFASQIDSISVGGGGAEGCVTVTFMNGDNVLLTRPVYIGDDCPDPITQGRIETPTKESTVQYNYTHSGWTSYNGGTANSSVLKNITEDKVVYSAYTKTAVKYTITYYDEDGTTVLHTEQLGYGTIPSYVPTKEGTTFGEWLPTPVMVTGDASYTVSWSSVLVSGTCGASGSSVNWALYNNYALVISGSGAMANYDNRDNDMPWANYQAQIKSIVIEEGVTQIGQYAFFKCNCTSAIIANSVTYISYNAFYQCAKLESVIIPDSVTTMGKAVFASCTNLESVTLGINITKIEQSAFSGTALTDLTIPHRVTSLGIYAFENCKSLRNVTIPISLKSIGEQTFYGCSSLTNVYYAGSETDKASITIGDYNTPLTNATWHYNYTN